MTQSKNELVLNPDFYSADAYMVEENEALISIKTLMKILMAIVIIGALIFLYSYYIKNNYVNISLWLSNAKEMLLVENKQPIIIREELSISQSIQPIEKIHKVEQVEVVKPKPIEINVLTDEYLKLMQDSLGKY